MIRIGDQKEVSGLRPAPKQAAVFSFEMTHSISKAIRYFILATSARHVRGQEDQHSTMLIHTSVLNSVHLATRAAVEPYLRNLARRLDDGDASLFREMEKIWRSEEHTSEEGHRGRKECVSTCK